jgi:hypothetical protein
MVKCAPKAHFAFETYPQNIRIVSYFLGTSPSDPSEKCSTQNGGLQIISDPHNTQSCPLTLKNTAENGGIQVLVTDDKANRIMFYY